uniref:Uncharacterized protein n=1 Tax=viral metagenome TaxID=1070528 RepID=A0A6M3IQE5_9ZZZZ
MKAMGPVPMGDVSENRRLSANIMPPLMDVISGEVYYNQYGRPLGAAHNSGRVSDFYLSVLECGRDDDAPINLSGELYINGVTCLTTKPSIGGAASEAGSQKTTRIAGDDDITQAVIDGSANDVTAGDVLSWDCIIDSQSSPDTKINGIVAVVVFEPESN